MEIRKRFRMSDPTDPEQLRHRRSWGVVALFRGASTSMLIRVAAAVAVAWLPLAVLTALHGREEFLSFLTDYASQSRFLLVIPVLMLGEKPTHARYALVAHHFAATLVCAEDQPSFQAQWISYERLKHSMLVRVLLLILTYAIAVWLSEYLRVDGSEFLNWWKGGDGFRFYSRAGTWALFVSYPILMYVTFRWLWRQATWARFLRLTARLNLKLIPVHPDHLGGMGFLEAALLGQLPFSFCLGVGLAGAIANRVFHEGQNVLAYRFLAPVLIATALLISVAPYFVFTPILMRMRRRGMLQYGAFAHAVGEQFEQKWLDREDALGAEVLTVPDFTSTGNLYRMVENIDEIRLVPVAAVNTYAFVIAALVPCIPVVIAAIPFDVLMKAALKLLV